MWTVTAKELCGRVVRPPQDEPEDAADEAAKAPNSSSTCWLRMPRRIDWNAIRRSAGQPEHHEDAETANDPRDAGSTTRNAFAPGRAPLLLRIQPCEHRATQNPGPGG